MWVLGFYSDRYVDRLYNLYAGVIQSCGLLIINPPCKEVVLVDSGIYESRVYISGGCGGCSVTSLFQRFELNG